jgi:hypothetical protein
VLASATFNDQLTVSGGPANGYLDFNVQTSGTAFTTCVGPDAAVCGSSSAGGRVSVAGSGVLIDGVGTAGVVVGNGVTSLDVRFPYSNDSGFVQFSLGTEMRCFASNLTSCSQTANYFDTLRVTGVGVLDTLGNPVQGATFTAESGTDYNKISAVPLPATGWLYLSAISALAGLRRRRAR